MDLTRSEKWWLAKARAEGGNTVAAGILACDPVADDPAPAGSGDQPSIAFGRFVSLMRRSQALNVEEFAEKAGLEVGELLAIEEDIRHVAQPRVVFRLSAALELPQSQLMQLAGLTAANDTGLGAEAVKFAARSESVEELTDQERTALEAFVAVLSKKRLSESGEEPDDR